MATEERTGFTITTFWMDWLLQPLVLGAAWLTVRWVLADMQQAATLGGWTWLPGWTVTIPLFASVVGWLVVGFGTLIKEEVWEFRFICRGLLIWALSCLVGAILIVLSSMPGGGAPAVHALLNLAGLALTALAIVLPAWVNHGSVDGVVRAARGWTVLMLTSAGCLTVGLLQGYPYSFPRLALALGVFFLLGLGLTEVTWQKTSFPWLLRLFQSNAGGRDYHDQFPTSITWRIEGAAKMVVGIAAALVLIMSSR